jgi:hypothetical protein
MPLHSDPHGGKLPTVVPGPTQPTPFPGEDGVDPARHRLHGQAGVCAPAAIDGPIQDVDHLLACRRLVTMPTRSGCGAIGLEMAVLLDGNPRQLSTLLSLLTRFVRSTTLVVHKVGQKYFPSTSARTEQTSS